MNKTFIIAEAGVNHNGDLEMAKKLIDVAKEAGADAVKFQAFKAELLVTKTAGTASYQKTTTGLDSQFNMLKQLELNLESHRLLQKYCQQKGILFLSSSFDVNSIQELHDLGLPLFKVPSGELTNYPYLKKVASFSKPIILSTGMANMAEIGQALDLVQKNGLPKDKVTILHCNTEYPTPMQDVNLRAMQSIAQEYKVKVGYSDHTPGIEVSIAAVALGAEVIEKHFTLDKNLPGPDHAASLEPSELIQMVKSIRNIELALGRAEKIPTESEAKNIVAARKSLVAAKNIKSGEPFTWDNITTKRPGSGISPMRWEQVIGKPAKRNFNEDELIEI